VLDSFLSAASPVVACQQAIGDGPAKAHSSLLGDLHGSALPPLMALHDCSSIRLSALAG